MARGGRYYFRTCKVCNRSFYTTAKQCADRCINHLKKDKTRSGFIGFWSKELRSQLMAKKFPLDAKEEILKKMLK